MRAFGLPDGSQHELEQLVMEKIRREEAFFAAEEPNRELLEEVADCDRRLKPALQHANAVVITDLVDTRVEFLHPDTVEPGNPSPIAAANTDFSALQTSGKGVDLPRFEWLLIELFFAFKRIDEEAMAYLLDGLSQQVPGLWNIRYLFVEDDTKLVMLYGHSTAPVRQVLRNLRFGAPISH